jgi:hypothetical protein
MIALLWFLLTLFASPLKSKRRLEAENAALRYQLIVLRRKVGGRVRLTNGDRLFFIQLYRWFPSVLKVITVIRPETLTVDRKRPVPPLPRPGPSYFQSNTSVRLPGAYAGL